MQKRFITTTLICLLLSFGMVFTVQAQKSSTGQLKSIHLFDMPSGVTEAELLAVFKDMNSSIKRLGYPDAGYHLYKVEGETPEEYQYFFEGVWPNAQAYKKIHEDKMYKESDKKANELIKKIQEVEIYRRLKRLN